MSTTSWQESTDCSDPLIDEVRSNRRLLVEEAGRDMARLFEKLRKVQADYDARTGQFAKLPRAVDEEPFPEMNKPLSNPFVDEVRAIRAKLAKEHGSP
jgi:hypothetical protein